MLDPVDPRTVRFDPEALLRALIEADVVFVLIGGMAALLHGDIVGTADVDAAVAEDEDNLERLVMVLEDLDGRLLVDAGDGQLATVDQPVDARWFTRMSSVRVLTAHGILDVVMLADGIGRYPDWAESAEPVELDVGSVRLAALADVIRSKEAAGREKDVAALPRLRELLRLSRDRPPPADRG